MAEAMNELEIENISYDPFWHSPADNRKAIAAATPAGADTVTVNNVLNVIKEQEARGQVIRQAAKALKPEGTALFLIYEGDKSGTGAETRDGYQVNAKAQTYVEDIREYFAEVRRSGAIIVAKNPIKRKTAGRWTPAEGQPAFSTVAPYGAESPAAEYKISTRTPSQQAGRPDPHLTTDLAVDYREIFDHPQFVDKLASVVRQYPTFKRGIRSSERVLEQFVEEAKSNLLWLHDQVPAKTRERSKLWYVGGRTIIDRWVARYDGKYTDSQMAGSIAAMSPQMDWDTNVTLAERIIEIWTNQQDFAWTKEMQKTGRRIYAKPSDAAIHRSITGKKLSELADDIERAMWIRAYDETYNPRTYRQVTPEGGFGDILKNDNGTPTRAGWLNGHGPMAKVISILQDGSLPNISRQLGSFHKVRNFYNNLYDPSDDHSVTIDTHAMAGSLLLPLGSSSQVVLDGFKAAGKNAELGLFGSYVLYAEAYRRAAAERGILPREMQSITWEALRRLYPAPFKTRYGKEPALAESISDTWAEYARRNGSVDDVRQGLLAIATSTGSIPEPAWHGSSSGLDAGAPDSSYQSSVLGSRWTGGTAGRRAGGNAAGRVRQKQNVVEASQAGYNVRQQAIPSTGATPPSPPTRQTPAPLQGGTPGSQATWQQMDDTKLDDVTPRLEHGYNLLGRCRLSNRAMNSSTSSRFPGVNAEYLLAARVADGNFRFLPPALAFACPATLAAASVRRCSSDTVTPKAEAMRSSVSDEYPCAPRSMRDKLLAFVLAAKATSSSVALRASLISRMTCPMCMG